MLFSGAVENLSDNELLSIFAHVPSVSLDREEIASGTVLDLLEKSQAINSRGDGKRLVKGGGVYINGKRIDDSGAPVGLIERSVIIVRTGKKTYHLVKLQ